MTNEASWHGPVDDPSAVHLDILHAQVLSWIRFLVCHEWNIT